MKKRIIELLMLASLGTVAQAEVTPTLVSTDALGGQGNDISFSPSISADGILVTFISLADNLVPGDTNNESDVFLKNTQTGDIVRLNNNAAATQGTGFRSSARISADGRFVAFTSGLDDDTGPRRDVSADVLVKNLETGNIVQANLDADSLPLDEDAYNPSISADGRFVAFELSEITSGSGGDVYVKDLTTGSLTRVNEDETGTRLNENSAYPQISGDGNIVVFENFVISQSPAPTLTLWSKNIGTGELVAVNSDVVGQQQVNPGSGHTISADGRLVAFSTSKALLPANINDFREVFVTNMDTGETRLVNANVNGEPGDGRSIKPIISADGNIVVFTSDASNLVAGDTNDSPDVFLKNLTTGEVIRIGKDVNGAGGLFDFHLNASGQRIVFVSDANDLLINDTNDKNDVFLIDTADIGPTMPGNLRFVIRSTTEAELLWDRASDIGNIIGYEVTRNGEVFELLDALSLSQSDLLPGVLYTFSVTALDDDGNRSATVTTSFSTNGVTPSKPASLRYQLYSDTTAEIFWERSTDDVVVQGYEILRNGELLGVFDVLSILDENLATGTAYTYSITAIDNEGTRSETATISFVTDGAAPDKPQNLQFQVYSNTAAEIFWDRSEGPNFVTGYEIVRNGELLGTRDSLSLFNDDLTPGVTYTYAVTAIDDQGNRSPAALISLLAFVDSQPVASGPSKPEDLRSQTYSDTAAEIFWNRSSDNGFVQGYEVVRNGVSIGVFDTQSLFDDELVPGITYTYDVTAIDNEGNRSATATTSLLTAIAKPSALSASVYSTSAAELFWDRPSMDGLVYEVERNGTIVGQLAGVSFLDDELASGATYQYKVTAVDMSGQRSEPAIVSLTTFSD